MLLSIHESFKEIFNHSIEIIERKLTIAEQAKSKGDYVLAMDIAYSAYNDAYALVESILTFKEYTDNQELVDAIRDQFFSIATQLHDKAFDLHKAIVATEPL